MEIAEFERRLVGRLCWACGGMTHRSHLRQWQCRHCRAKWSYRRLRQRWELMRLYCSGTGLKRAAAASGVSERTARAAFSRFRTILRQQPASLWRYTHPFADVPRPPHVRASLAAVFFTAEFLPKIEMRMRARRASQPPG